MVKLDVDMLPTVPDAPPAAGPDRALDPPPPAALSPEAGDEAVAEVDVPQPAASPITAHVSAAAAILPILLRVGGICWRLVGSFIVVLPFQMSRTRPRVAVLHARSVSAACHGTVGLFELLATDRQQGRVSCRRLSAKLCFRGRRWPRRRRSPRRAPRQRQDLQFGRSGSRAERRQPRRRASR
jgi:hypothetical protein